MKTEKNMTEQESIFLEWFKVQWLGHLHRITPDLLRTGLGLLNESDMKIDDTWYYTTATKFVHNRGMELLNRPPITTAYEAEVEKIEVELPDPKKKDVVDKEPYEEMENPFEEYINPPINKKKK